MSAERGRLARVAAAIAAVYFAFLLCAQFGFLAQLEQALGEDDPAALAVALGAMALGGIGAGFAAARLLVRFGAHRTVRAGLVATALAAVASTGATAPASFALAAAALGAALGASTVALAGALPRLAPDGRLGRAVGLGTGTAYLLANLPIFFAGSPAVRAWIPAAACLAAALLVPRDRAEGSPASVASAPPFPALVAIFTLLVALDSGAFAFVQHDPGLLALSWGGSANSLRQGVVHFAAALVAGHAIDRGRLRGLLLATAGLFAVALPALAGHGVVVALAAGAYAAGISFYSAALVAAPASRATSGPESPALRAAWLFALAGWIGSGAGVGLSQHLAWRSIVGAAWLVAALVAFLSLAGGGVSGRGWLPTVGLAATAIFVVSTIPATPPTAELVARGREVYLEEGCQHCHSQYVRPGGGPDEIWWGPHRPLDRSERPPTPGNRRIGPDLSNVGLRRSAVWQELHLRNPRAISPGSRMPSYAHLFDAGSDRGTALVAYLGTLGAGAEGERWQIVRSTPPVAPAHPPSLARGRALFVRFCAPCHGPAGRGDGPVLASWHLATLDLADGPLSRVGELGREAGDPAALERVIRFGLPPFTMAGHEWLSDQEVADLAAWVRSLRDPDGAPAG